MARQWCSYAKKPRFPNKLECDLAIVSIQVANKHHRKQKSREEPSRSFRCEHCKGYHMTSQLENESRRTVSN